MFWHVIVGLLRDGQPRHGYELRRVFLKRSGTHVGPGNFYRELTRLTAAGLVRQVTNPPEMDGRRIPYEITPRGGNAFDEWLLAGQRREDDLHEWILFVDRVPSDVRERVIARRLEDLWIRHKLLARLREEAAAEMAEAFHPRLASIIREMKQMAAEIEFLDEFREQLAAWENGTAAATRRSSEERVGPTVSTATQPPRSPLPQVASGARKGGASR